MWLGVVLAGLAVAVATAVIYPLKPLAPVVSLSVVYLPAVLLVSAVWGLALGVATVAGERARRSTSSTSRRPAGSRSPTARTGSRSRAFLVVAVVASSVAELARAARARGRSAGARRPTSRPSWRACCCAERRLERGAGSTARAPGAGARAAVGRDRARRGPPERRRRRRASRWPRRRAGRARCWSAPTFRPRRSRAPAGARRARPLEALLSARARARRRCRRRSSRRRRCAAATTSRRRCCAPSRTTCARR